MHRHTKPHAKLGRRQVATEIGDLDLLDVHQAVTICQCLQRHLRSGRDSACCGQLSMCNTPYGIVQSMPVLNACVRGCDRVEACRFLYFSVTLHTILKLNRD